MRIAERVLLFLFLIQRMVAQAQECPYAQYLDADENMCKPLPSGFTHFLNATRYDIVTEAEDSSIPAETYLFSFRLYVNNSDSDIIIVVEEVTFDVDGQGGQATTYNDLTGNFEFVDFDVRNTAEFSIGTVYETVLNIHPIFTDQIILASANISVNVTKSNDPCGNIECLNGGTCIPDGKSFTCQCPNGFFGNTCEDNPCDPDPCNNNGNCSAISYQQYSCTCIPGYTADDCSENIDDCVSVDCGNGSCIDMINDYECMCALGYTGSHCMTDIDECASNPCVNGTCKDSINDFICECYTDWAGKTCNEEINICEDPSSDQFPCDAIGFIKCIDGNDTFTCECRVGYTGVDCGQLIQCAIDPCKNNATCIDVDDGYSCECAFGYEGDDCEIITNFCTQHNPCIYGTCLSIEAVGSECICLPGYTGSDCSVEIDECSDNKCQNGATCIDSINGYTCACAPDYTGDLCDIEQLFCQATSCLNGGTCVDQDGGNETLCLCSGGFLGDNCEIDMDVCNVLPQKCYNGATCNEGYGSSYNCTCIDGFDGFNCSEDLDYCSKSYCKNGGTCIEGYGNKISCECSDDFGGDQCETELIYCMENDCLNGGSCIDLDGGSGTLCFCASGFSGDMCENDDDVCEELPQKCFNGGSCNEGLGADYSCECLEGFGGDDCSEDLDFCGDYYCLNGGLCIEGYGTERECNCSEAYQGDKCETAFCPVGWCDNGGICSVQDNKPVCDCNGCEGDQCEIEVDVCQNSVCRNGGTCIEGTCSNYTCVCLSTFVGNNCETPVCQDDTCLNGGSCSVVENELVCDCSDGFNGTNCEIDLDYCTDGYCQNGGTCIEGIGTSISCNCSECFSGSNCEIDDSVCTDDLCLNGGKCIEGYGCDYECNCTETYQGNQCETAYCPENWCYNGGNCSVVANTVECSCEAKCNGDRCETDLSSVCSADSCMNGGTCVDEACSDYTCICSSTFTGSNCETPVCQDDTCLNGGNCSVVSNKLMCHCPVGFNGTNCEIDLSHCTDGYCQNGGTCIEGIGTSISCNCSECFSGSNCGIDESVCTDDHCLNGGECIEGYGCDYECNCTETYQGNQCETVFCPENWCYNGGNCSVVANAVECSCEAKCSGDRCETDLSSVCSADSCMNGGTCVDEACSDYTCICSSTFIGSNCETPVCQDDTCLNGGNCSVVNDELICECPVGFNGTYCEMDLDHCTIGYCENGGTCVEGIGSSISCDCLDCFSGDHCEKDTSFCDNLSDHCLNNGTCVDDYGCDYHCDCTETYMGDKCETPFCPDNWCLNGGECTIENNKTGCECDQGCSGDRCEDDSDVCSDSLCKNGGTCKEGPCLTFSCECMEGYSGDTCEVFTSLMCKSDSDCSSETFCEIDCPSDNYVSHTALLVDEVTLSGISFVNVERIRHPDLSVEFSMFAVYNQDPSNRGYLVYYGTTAQRRNFGLFLDSESAKLYLYYTNTTGHLKSYIIDNDALRGGYDNYLAVTFKGGVINVFLNGSDIGVESLLNPDFSYGIASDTISTKLFVGARYPRHYRFIGTIKQVIFFQSVLNQSYIQELQEEFNSVVNPTGSCIAYKALDSVCPEPKTAPSTLCTSSMNRCDPSLRCLPSINGNYTCQLQPPICSSDSDCSPNYFCGSRLPFNGSNYFDNSLTEIPGEAVFLQDNSLELDGEEVAILPTSDAPHLESDITIFAVVHQEPGNDGYVVGKGINGNMRDFGLYLRSSRKTVWLVYGADSHGVGYKEIVFFHNVSVADGKFHSIAAVVDSTANRTQLYIDGEVVGQQSPLPSTPTFRPGQNLLYVGGRPSTNYFRFKGTIRNLFISSAPLQKDNVMKLHTDAMDGDEKISLELPTSHYCLQYKSSGESCVVGDDKSDFRCQSPAVCVPEVTSTVIRNLPSASSAFTMLGVCVEPCDCDDNLVQEECGVDGSTYKNKCFRQCVNIGYKHDGKCTC